MLPFLGSAVFGFLKGSTLPAPCTTTRSRLAEAVVVAPVVEEAIYRVGVGRVFAGLGAGPAALLTSAAFAADHSLSEGGRGGVARFADVFAGGMMYHQAYSRYGIVGAIAAHALHNLSVHAGQSWSARKNHAKIRNPIRVPRRGRR